MNTLGRKGSSWPHWTSLPRHFLISNKPLYMNGFQVDENIRYQTRQHFLQCCAQQSKRTISDATCGIAGVEAINSHFHRILEPGRPSVDAGRICEAEPIIWTRNDWNRGFMNGSIGRLKVVKPQTNTATVELDGLDVELLSGDWSFVDLAA